ncbi:uncharacterized protein GGS25DRAFT_220460 [Hypoxylon fragiforme]|uniref:uncharacterized protein n=1 Tax=Hypoxylon fragiforme TaxID=63214 RepID=UPI0020C717E5|nr:uncharacterized protein GGS25DRAFT_220460 [Hypoxylon fragiforme]KAI2609551.1 hypothetical protein GGS25DRAFT_220460 [Hypoxylon fragiforme]
MRFYAATGASLLLAGQALAAPLQARDDVKTSAQIVAEIAPLSASCANTDECRTAEQAGPLLAQAMNQYGLSSAGQIAAVLALTAYESLEYQNKINLSKNPGQGTSNMQQFPSNLKYAQSIEELKGHVAGVTEATATDDKKNEILHLVIDDKYNFGSGPWYLTTQCKPDVVEGLKSASDESFLAYMACVGIQDVNPKRLGYWTAAKKAFNL